MIKLKDILLELKATSFKTGAAHETKTIKNVHHGRIPIYPTLMKKVIGDVPINAFHNTDWFKAKSLKNVIGKKKSLSSYTSLTKNSNSLNFEVLSLKLRTFKMAFINEENMIFKLNDTINSW